MPQYPATTVARGTRISDDPEHCCYFRLTCGSCGLRLSKLTFAEVRRRQDQHDTHCPQRSTR